MTDERLSGPNILTKVAVLTQMIPSSVLSRDDLTCLKSCGCVQTEPDRKEELEIIRSNVERRKT